jgi:hypothetical protein
MVIIVNFFPEVIFLCVKCICCQGTREIGGSWECDESRYSGMGFFHISKKSHSKKVHHYAFLSVLIKKLFQSVLLCKLEHYTHNVQRYSAINHLMFQIL